MILHAFYLNGQSSTVPLAAYDQETAIVPDTEGWTCPICRESPQLDGWWRWTGDSWQHHHGYPAGHIDANYKPAKAGEEE